MVTYKFRDEFTGPAGSSPNPNKWTYDLGGGGGWGNNELETYTASRDNSFLDGSGHLVIRAIKTADGYTSARLKTLGKFAHAYGTWEARIKIDSTQGLWPAWWAMGASGSWPACGEVDMVEDYGWNFAETTVHIPDGQGGMIAPAINQTYADQPLDGNWHTYQMYWAPGRFTFRRDGVVYLRTTPQGNWPYSNELPMYMLLNLAVGGDGGGDVPVDTQFPVDMLVDYVRVW